MRYKINTIIIILLILVFVLLVSLVSLYLNFNNVLKTQVLLKDESNSKSLAIMEITKSMDENNKKYNQVVNQNTKFFEEKTLNYKMIINSLRESVILLNNKDKIEFSNKQVERMFKYSSTELKNQNISKLIFKSEIESFKRYNDSKYSLPYEIKAVKKDGTEFFIELLRIRNIYKIKEKNKFDLIIIKNISEYKKIKIKLEEENEKSLNILNSISAGVILINENYKIESLNPIAKKIIDVSSPIGEKVYKLFTLKSGYDDSIFKIEIPEYKNNTRIFTQNKSLILETKNSQKIQILYSISPIILKDSARTKGAVIVFQDTTYKEKMERELAKQEKLKSIGILAGGIAHDFNNFLTSLLGNIILAKETTNEKELKSLLDESERAIERATSLTKQLLIFSKKDKPILEVVSNLDLLVKEYISFALRGSNIKLNFKENKEKIWNSIIDKNQISQVIHNISVNSKQAMHSGGEIFYKIENIEYVKETLFHGLNIKKGQYIKICIRDTGEGIKKEIISNIFEPYFTTKETGTGLGLPVSYSIIKKHNGEMIINSKENIGTTVTILLPSTDKKVKEIATIKIDKHAYNKKLDILIVDDQEMILKILKKVLIKEGHTVISSITGEEGFLKYQERYLSNKKIDLVITDLTIPNGMGGEKLAQKILKLDKEAKLIVSSGYSSSPIMANYKKYGFKATLPKPYKISDIKYAIIKVFSK